MDELLKNRHPVVIAGPTASGKSSLALKIAVRDNGLIINADALQVYDCWKVLTARPSDADCQTAAHRLFGHVAADVRYSVGDWLRDIAPVIADARAAGKRPVIVGGTGLYLTALTSGLAEIPPVPESIRIESQALVDSGNTQVLIDHLIERDPETAQSIDCGNPVRVQRAWNVLKATGRGLQYWQSRTPAPLIPEAEADLYLLSPEIPLLNRRIEMRFHKMVEDGALEECRAFAAAGTDRSLPSAQAIGAEQLLAYLNGKTSLDEALQRAVILTRQYAKRQRTWLRRRMSGWTEVCPTEAEILFKNR